MEVIQKRLLYDYCICRAISSRIKYSNILRKLRITTAICNCGRNRKICEAFVKTKKSIQDLEREMLNGQSIQGPATAEAIFMMLKKHNLISRFPLLIAVHQICKQQLSPNLLIERLRECKGKLPDKWMKM
nr:Bm4186 [Brugia malayi]